MLLSVDTASERPIYEQIADAVRRAVARGEILAGEKLPPASEVATGLDVNKHTVLRAYQTLVTLALRSHRAGGLRRDDPAGRLLRGFRVELLASGPPDDNGYLRAPHFVIHRLRKSA